MSAPLTANQDQARLWNGTAGQAWVEGQALLDALFAPLADVLVDAARDADAKRVLDIGCGAGATTLAIAQALGAEARCEGLDISEPLIALARERAARIGVNAVFHGADAQTKTFDDASFDLLVSRFGVMFFDDPVAAFANLRNAARPDARLCAIAWRDAAENPFMTTAERAAAPLLPELPPRKPDAPGQFAFADGERVRELLTRAGWREVAVEPLDVTCVFPKTHLGFYFTRLGPLAQFLPTIDPERRATVIEAVRPAFAPFVHDDEVRFVAACWRITARC